MLESFREGNSCPLGEDSVDTDMASGMREQLSLEWDRKAVGQGMTAAGLRQGWTLGGVRF